MEKPVETVIIVSVICAWGVVLLAAITAWSREIIRKIETTPLGRRSS